MSENQLVKHCAATLAGIKSGSLLNCRYECPRQLSEELELWNEELGPKGVEVVCLRLTRDRALIYVYRPGQLAEALRAHQAVGILKKMGYSSLEVQYCIRELAYRIGTTDQFPHEIGLFLGYPPKDVSEFMNNNGKNGLYTGLWKVYDNVEEAKATFEKFQKCRAVYEKGLSKGLSVKRLTVVA